ncbi:MAG: PTS glucose transporter subunit IIA [Aeromonadales bacterium]|nr:PTS glucose transporter subunit IIA [Aeromonadales bacterium]
MYKNTTKKYSSRLSIYITKLLRRMVSLIKDDSITRIISPFSGNVVPSSLLGEINLKNDVFGMSFGVLPINNLVQAPCDCLIDKISPLGNGYSLIVGSVQLILNIGLDRDLYSQDMFKVNVKEGDSVKKGQTILTFDMDALYAIDRSFVCVLTVKQLRQNKFVNFINTRRVGYDSILCLLNTN